MMGPIEFIKLRWYWYELWTGPYLYHLHACMTCVFVMYVMSM